MHAAMRGTLHYACAAGLWLLALPASPRAQLGFTSRQSKFDAAPPLYQIETAFDTT